MNRTNQLTKIHLSGKPYIIYKSQNGFDLYTDFSKKIILNNKNIKSFLTKKNKKQSTNTDLFIGFFGYELLNNLIDVFLLIDLFYSIYSVLSLKTGSSLIGKWIIAAKIDNAISKYHA